MQHTRGIGIDSVEIERFAQWHTYSEKSLLRIFSTNEIAYCKSIPIKSAERFGARFAVREAFLKALHQAMPTLKIPFFTVCKAIETVSFTNGVPGILITWELLKIPAENSMRCSVSWTHTKTMATAIVVIDI